MIKLFVGPMGSGKSEKLLIHLHEKLQDGTPVVCLKPEIDTRAKNEIRSRNGNFHKAISVNTFYDVLDIVQYYYRRGVKNFIIDEIQFIQSTGLYSFVDFVHGMNINVYAAGLNQTSEMKPFEVTSHFAMFADFIEVLKGVCVYCGGPSKRTRCTVKKEDTILIGDDVYEQTCYTCASLLNNMCTK